MEREKGMRKQPSAPMAAIILNIGNSTVKYDVILPFSWGFIKLWNNKL
jgi:hypothetical protein